MKYALIKSYGEYVIVNDDANFQIGEAHSAGGDGKGPFRVLAYVTPGYGTIEVATVNSVDECVTALADYYKKNPPRWVRKSKGWYEKKTLYSNLRVEQDQRGRWGVCRDDYPLLQHGGPVTFSTYAEAQRVADAHQLDDYPDAQLIDDGFHWLLDPEINWRSLPDVVEGRARWEILASLSRP
jgi:hypothetical protein